jgi:zinc D-Ala-D-Ala carboxypeptidase
MPADQLTQHFTLDELIVSQTAARKGINNIPPPDVVAELRRTAELMERIRAFLGSHPVLVSSGYRSPALNAVVGGAVSSAHMAGRAVDFIVPGFGSPRDICRALEPKMAEFGVDQLIHEYEAWVHVGTAPKPRAQALTADIGGTRRGFG